METYPVPLAFDFGISSPQLIIFTSTRGLLLSSTLWISISDTISWPCNTWPNITWTNKINIPQYKQEQHCWSVGNHWSVTCFWVALQQTKMHYVYKSCTISLLNLAFFLFHEFVFANKYPHEKKTCKILI